ncbi:hypothetical protein DVH24_008561 [Malus domestica]|uniref:Uncharacterized protein n=1 Tax=Malus domestica TaxID=3750 RepID=A0A498JS34_MALDO|nr:hypothetical protein DVH24_008561 [Malus domestica]
MTKNAKKTSCKCPIVGIRRGARELHYTTIYNDGSGASDAHEYLYLRFFDKIRAKNIDTADYKITNIQYFLSLGCTMDPSVHMLEIISVLYLMFAQICDLREDILSFVSPRGHPFLCLMQTTNMNFFFPTKPTLRFELGLNPWGVYYEINGSNTCIVADCVVH